MTDLDDAMEVHMAQINFEQNRPVTYRDFLDFEVEGKEYRMTHGTFRNKISKLIKSGVAVLAFNSGLAFYTLYGVQFGKKTMTSTHVGGLAKFSSDPIVRLIESLPMQSNALHDIRLRFLAERLWPTVSADSRYMIDPYSNDIRLKPYRIGNLNVVTTIHKTDTVSVVVGCSYNPIGVDIPGIITLSNTLTRVEERLSRLVEDCCRINAAEGRVREGILPSIPEHRSWTVTMWHFGADSSKEYTGDKFSVTWEVGEHALIRAYSKDIVRGGEATRTSKTRRRVRLERQEYPNKTFVDAVEEKLKCK